MQSELGRIGVINSVPFTGFILAEGTYQAGYLYSESQSMK